jgi:hypothetical protein
MQSDVPSLVHLRLNRHGLCRLGVVVPTDEERMVILFVSEPRAVSFIFAGDFDGKGQKPKSLLKIVVNVSGFTDGFKALEEACVRSR